ncbi:hypothetical protein KCU91_g5100, partial [Aureobasidium melanogenum]
MIAAQRTDFQYRPSQPWVSTNLKLTYVFENGDGLEDDGNTIEDGSVVGADNESSTNDQATRLQYGKDGGPPGQSTGSTAGSVQLESLNTLTGLSDTPETRTSLSYVLSSSSTSVKESPLTCSNTTVTDIQTPKDISTSLVQPLTHREALLVQCFIGVISPWLDVLQDVPRFAQEVPVRATKSPMLLFAILAASSRWQTLRDSDWQEAAGYHSKCLTLVIQALSQPDLCHDDNLIVTMVCLRLYELFNSQPFSSLHLDGLASLLSAIPSFLQSGGLAEAAAWLALRHDLFMAMVAKRAPRISLNDYDHSNVFQRPLTPGAKAYAIILIWAKILRHLYSTDQHDSPTTWPEIERAVADWYDQSGIEPLFQQNSNVDPDQPFPIISMTSAAHVVALEYYHNCQIYINLYKLLDLQHDIPAAVKDDRHQAAINSMCSILGIALSNTWAEDAIFPGLHIIITCGHHFTDSLQRDHALRFLDSITTKFGYRTDRLVNALKHQWAEHDASKD